MRLNRSTSYAIRIMIECAREGGGLVKVADLSGRLRITPQNVFKVVHILSRAGLISATRGRSGGVKLARDAAAIRVGDVVRAVETTIIELDSDPATRTDREISDGVNRVLDSALEAFTSILDQHTIADMAAVGALDARRVPRGSKKSRNRPQTHDRAARRSAASSAAGPRSHSRRQAP